MTSGSGKHSSSPVLTVRNLSVDFATHGGRVHAVRGVSLDLYPGEVLAIVGESGCGKSVTVQTIMGLLPRPPGRILEGSIRMGDCELLDLSEEEYSGLRGRKIGMIFQDPLTSLNPTMKVGDQIREVLRRHNTLPSHEVDQRVLELLEMVRIPDPKLRLRQYPHEFSGGMRQRIMIAIAIACRPQILIADEPTTALDVTIQQQILSLILDLRQQVGMATLLITHDLGVVAQVADRVAVMYAGEIVETGSVEAIFSAPHHPYTLGLHRAMPNPRRKGAERLHAIAGSPPDLFAPPKGCGFFDRCNHALEICRSSRPETLAVAREHEARCWLYHDQAPKRFSEQLRQQYLMDTAHDHPR